VKRRRAAAPYAKALFALAKERDETELIGRELGEAAATFESVAELRDFLARPWIPAPVKRTVVTEIAQRSSLSRLTTDFLALVAGRGRTDHLKVIAEKYQKRLDEDLGLARARVHTTMPLTSEERGALTAKLGKAGEPAGGARGDRRPRDAARFHRRERQCRGGREPRGPAGSDSPASRE
jgi:F-type H+-transporting ATPase subunit delta